MGGSAGEQLEDYDWTAKQDQGNEDQFHGSELQGISVLRAVVHQFVKVLVGRFFQVVVTVAGRAGLVTRAQILAEGQSVEVAQANFGVEGIRELHGWLWVVGWEGAASLMSLVWLRCSAVARVEIPNFRRTPHKRLEW